MRKWNWKKTAVAALCAGLAAVTAGCGSKETADNKKVLTILTADDTSEGGPLKTMADKYAAEKGIEVQFTEIPYNDMETKLLNMIKAGNAPAIVRYASYGQLADYTLDITDIAPKAEEMHMETVIDGKIRALVSNVTANGLIINKTLFDQAGVAYPASEDDIWTWDEFIAGMRTVIEKTDAEYGIVVDHSQQRFSTLLYQNGGAMFSDDMTKCVLNSPQNLETTEMFLSLFEEGLSPKSTWAGTEDPAAMFKTGKVAAHLSGNWKLADYYENIKNFEWLPVYMPYTTQRATVPGGNFIYAIDGSGMEEEAKAFLTWFYEPENYAEYCKIGNYLPGRTGVEVDYQVEGLEVFQNELEASQANSKVNEKVSIKYAGSSWGNVLRDSLDAAIAGQKTSQEVLDDSVSAILEAFSGMTVE